MVSQVSHLTPLVAKVIEMCVYDWTSINNSTNKIIETIQLFYDI